MDMQVGHFEPDGNVIYLPVGFRPSLFLLCEIGVTNPIFYIWWGQTEGDEASGSIDGIKIVGGSGTFDKLSDAGGFADYDTGSQGPTISQWVADTANVVRTATAHGSYVKPTTSGTDDNGLVADREAVYECVAGSSDLKTHATTEPTWPSQVGGQVIDDVLTWEKVDDAAIKRIGYEGIRIAGALMTDGQEMYYAAWLCVEKDWGDVAGWTSGVYDS
jgi:hypothetical protein